MKRRRNDIKNIFIICSPAVSLRVCRCFLRGGPQVAGSFPTAFLSCSLLSGGPHVDELPPISLLCPIPSTLFPLIIQTDPTKINQAGHLLYTDYPVYSQFAAVTGSGVINTASGSAGGVYPNHEQIAFVVTSSLGRDAGSTTVPNFENFEDRFRTALSPFVTSQEFGGAARNLFRVHALDDGAYINGRVKISIENIQKSRNDKDPNGSFDLLVRDFMDNDRDPVVLEKFTNLSLNPNSENYVARRIGDQHTFYDFDRNVGVQKLVVDGNYPNLSNYIRVETSDQLEGGEMPDEALPVGFRGHMHLVTSGSGILANPTMHGLISGSLATGDAHHILHSTIEPPTPFRDNLTLGTGVNKRLKNQFYWGVQFEVKEDEDLEKRLKSLDRLLRMLPSRIDVGKTSKSQEDRNQTDIERDSKLLESAMYGHNSVGDGFETTDFGAGTRHPSAIIAFQPTRGRLFAARL